MLQPDDNMQKLPEISVILPVFNAEKFIVSTIDSILNQSFTDFELIIVDDGSTDESSKICDDYAIKDSRVRVVHQENLGTCEARNQGLVLSKGRYIAFCDHDDEYLPKLLADSYSLMQQENADVICFSVNQVFNDDVRCTIKRDVLQDVIIDGEDIPSVYMSIHFIPKMDYVWNKIYRRSLVKDIRFNPIFKHGLEDTLFNMEVLKRLKGKYVFTSSICYNRNVRKTSSGGLFKEEKADDRFNAYEYFFQKEFETLMYFRSLTTSPSICKKESDAMMVRYLYWLYYRSPLKNPYLTQSRKWEIFSHYPYRLSRQAFILHWSFMHCIVLFKILCMNNFCNIDIMEKQLLLKNREIDYFNSPLSGFFLNLYLSRKGRWLFNLCNWFIRLITLPFRLLNR